VERVVRKVLAVLLFLVGIYAIACTTFVTQTYCNEILGVVQHYAFAIILGFSVMYVWWDD